MLHLTARTAQAQALSSSLTSNVTAAQQLSTEVATVRRLAGTRFPWPRLLDQIGQLMPAGTALSSLQSGGAPGSAAGTAGSSTAGSSTAGSAGSGASAPASLQLAGCATSQSTVALTMDRLRGVSGVSDVQLASSAESSANGASSAGITTSAAGGTCKYPVQFQMSLVFGDPSGAAASATSTTGVKPMTLRPRDRVVLVAVLFLIVAGAFYMLVLTPERHKVKALNGKIVTQQQALTAAQQQVAAGRAAGAALRAAQAQQASVDVAVPAQLNTPELLRALERAATAAHVQMQSITVGAAASSTPQSSGAPGGTTSTSGAGVPNATQVQLTFAGGYLALEKLVRRLDGFVVLSGNRVHATGPLLSVSSVQISGTPNLVAHLNANIYQRPAASAPTGATPTGAPTTATQAAMKTEG